MPDNYINVTFAIMEIFLDTEFTTLQQDGELISLALVSTDDHWFYAEFTDFDESVLSDWHKENVLSHLFLKQQKSPVFAKGEGTTIRGTKEEITRKLKDWLRNFEKIEIWADALAYDWVFFCELFGGALHLPSNIFYLPFDLVTLLKMHGLNPDAQRESLVQEWVLQNLGPKHNALYDAFLSRAVYQKLAKIAT